jgi:hypothetical protein
MGFSLDQFFIQIFFLNSLFYSPTDAVSSGEHPVLIDDAAAAAVGVEVLQGNQRGVFTLGCVGAIHDAVLSNCLLKSLRQGCIK